MARVEEAELSFAELESMDSGKIGRLVKSHLQKLAQDCINRPGDDSPRTMLVQFDFTPLPEPDTGEAETANLKISVKSKVPTFKSKKYEMRLGQKGFRFNKDFPDDIDQPPLPFDREAGA